MNAALRQRLERAGAVPDAASGRPRHFGEPAEELAAALGRCAIADRSHLGRLLAEGPDALDLLQRLSTGDLASLSAGRGRPTVLTSPKGRILQRLFVHHLGSTGVVLVAGPEGGERVRDHLARFTFREKTGLSNVGDRWAHLALIGPAAREVATALGLPAPDGWACEEVEIAGGPAHVLGGDGLSAEGVSVLVPGERAADAWSVLHAGVTSRGGRAVGDEVVEAWRILRGLPEHGHELTEEHHPLEAGLRDAVSFDKGCYVGQEVVARLNTYDKVTHVVAGLVLPAGSAVPGAGAAVSDGKSAAGRVTSAVRPPGSPAPVALAYLRRAVADPGVELRVGEGPEAVQAVTSALPFEHPPPSG